MATDPNIVTENLIGGDESENLMDATLTEDEVAQDELLKINKEQPVFEEVEVAGRFTPKSKRPFKERLDERIQEAEEKILPKGPVERVSIENNRIIVRGIEDDELKNIEEYIPEAGDGVNFIKIVDQLERVIPEITDDSMGIVFENIKIKNKKLFDAAKRGTLTMADMLNMAEKNGIILNAEKFLKRKPGEILPAEDFLAGILALVNWRSEVKKAYQIAKEINEPDARNLAMGKVLRMAAAEQQLASNIAANLSEYGRGLSVVRNLSSLNLDINTRSGALTDWADSFDDKQTFEYMMEKYITLPDSGKKVYLERSLAARTLDAVAEAYVMGVLTSLRTHVVNIASTGLNNVIQMPVDALSGGIGYARTSLGLGSQRSYAKEWIYRSEGMRLTLMDAFLLSGKSLIKDEPSDFTSKIDLNRRKSFTAENFNIDPDSWTGKVFDLIGTYNRLAGRFLVAEDEFFKVLGAGGEARVLAFRRSMELYEEVLPKVGVEEATKIQKEEYLRLIEDIPQDIRTESEDAARYFAFQEPIEGWLGDLSSFMAHPAVKILGTAFFKTPTNVIGQTSQYGPLGIFKVVRDYWSGDQIAADRALAKVAIGTSVMGALSYLTWNGGYGENVFATGGGPTDYKARQAWQRKGLLPYSFCSRDNDDDLYECISYARFEPASGMLAVAADFVYYAQHEEDLSKVEAVGLAATLAMAEYASEMPMLEGISDIAELFNNVLYPTKIDKIRRFFEMTTEKSTAAVLAGTPTFGAFARSIEQTAINKDASATALPPEGYAFPFAVNDSGYRGPLITELSPPLIGFYKALNKAMAGNPFFSSKVPPKLNRWGEVVPQGTGEYYEVFSPIRKSYEIDGEFSQFDKEIMDLGVGIDMPPKKISGVKLNRIQYNQLLEIAAVIDNNFKMPGDAGYKEDQSLLKQLQFEMQQDYYFTKNVTYYDQTEQVETTNEEKAKYLNNIVHQADNRAIYYLKKIDLNLNSLINARE